MTQKMLRVMLAEGGNGETTQSLRAVFPEKEARLDLTVVSTVMTLLPTLKVVGPEILLLDLSLAQPNPLDTVKRLHRSAPGVPLIVIADPAEREIAKRCLSEGAMDFLIKGFMDQRTVEGVLREALESNTLNGLTDFLRDPLTGLYTREGFLTLGSRSMELARRSSGTMVLLCALLENLDSLPKQSGSGAREKALKDLGEVLEGSFRKTDIIARFGDPEFAALAVDAAEPSVAVLRQRLEKRLEFCNQLRGASGPLEVRLNAGYWSSADKRSFEEFLNGIELSLHEAPTLSTNLKN